MYQKNFAVKQNSLSKNAFYNFLGFSIPLIFAVSLVPFIIEKLGVEKFGILSFCWLIIGYFGFFDLGIGRALTRIVSEKIGQKKDFEIPSFFWTSFYLTALFSLIISLILFLSSDTLILYFLKIPSTLTEETILTIKFLILAIPVITTTASMKGFLEAYSRFDIVNFLRLILGVSSFLIPLILLFWTTYLYWIIIAMICVRVFIWCLYLYFTLKTNSDLKKEFKFHYQLIKPIFHLSSWMTVSNIAVPLIVYIDRIMIASLVSTTAVAYYATPYEVITKLLIFPSALTAVLFPTFAANYLSNPERIVKLLNKAMKYIFILLLPITLIVVFFSNELLSIWLGKEFASKSFFILRFLSIGILFNSIAFIPFSFIEGIGRPDVTAKIQLIELPIYVFLMWLVVKNFGTSGAAVLFMSRMIIDCILMIYFSQRLSGSKAVFRIKCSSASIFFFSLIVIIAIINSTLWIKILSIIIIISSFLFITWKFLLDFEDRILIKENLLPLIGKKSYLK